MQPTPCSKSVKPNTHIAARQLPLRHAANPAIGLNIGKHDVIHKTEVYNVLNLFAAREGPNLSHMHRKFGEAWTCGFSYMHANRQTCSSQCYTHLPGRSNNFRCSKTTLLFGLQHLNLQSFAISENIKTGAQFVNDSNSKLH